MAVFIVEDGTGKTDATSYVDVTTATDYISINPHEVTWTSTSLDRKQNVLMWATQLIDTSVEFYGVKRYPSASLRFPRSGLVDPDGYPISEDEIPVPLKKAVAEFARLLNVKDRTAEPATRGISELRADETMIVFDKTDRVSVFPNSIWRYLSSLGYVASGSRVRTVRR